MFVRIVTMIKQDEGVRENPVTAISYSRLFLPMFLGCHITLKGDPKFVSYSILLSFAGCRFKELFIYLLFPRTSSGQKIYMFEGVYVHNVIFTE